MPLNFKTATAAAVSATALMIASGAMAASVSIEQIDASWQNPTGSAIDIFNYTIDNTSDPVTIFWGTPDTDAGQSGYSFGPASVPFDADPDTAYSLGTFTHFNRPILSSGGELSTVELNFAFGGTPDGGSLITLGSIFGFEHDETTNTSTVAACGALQESSTPCDDIVEVGALAGPTGEVTVGETTYIFTLLGFSPDGSDGSFSSIFVTEEGEENARDLWFSYTTETNVVPLPAAGWLLLAGVGGLAAIGRRRKSA
ncbi:MAG: THxN family PEP-CTERM protein [Rhodovulum sp.]